MASDNTLVKVGLFAGAAYLAYQQGWLSFLGIGSSAPAATPAPSTPATQPVSAPPAQPSAPPAPTYPPLSQIYSQMVAIANQSWQGASSCGSQPIVGTTAIPGGAVIPDPTSLVALTNWQMCVGSAQTPKFTMDDWNAFAVRAGAPNPMPDPVPVFPGVVRSTLMTAQDYWGPMSAALALKGLSGYARFRRAA